MEMLQETQGYRLPAGVRGQQPLASNALTDLLVSMSRMVTDRREMQELDLNPVRVYDKGILALDARILTSG